jgi:hypothetical protein
MRILTACDFFHHPGRRFGFILRDNASSAAASPTTKPPHTTPPSRHRLPFFHRVQSTTNHPPSSALSWSTPTAPIWTKPMHENLATTRAWPVRLQGTPSPKLAQGNSANATHRLASPWIFLIVRAADSIVALHPLAWCEKTPHTEPRQPKIRR